MRRTGVTQHWGASELLYTFDWDTITNSLVVAW